MQNVIVVLFVLIVFAVAIGKVVMSRGGKAANARLRGYGVVVDGDQVKSGGIVLGPLAGAQAIVTDGTSRHTLTRVMTVAGAATKKTKAAVIVTTADGRVRQHNIEGAAELRRAQAWVVRFNALAAAAGPASGPVPLPPPAAQRPAYGQHRRPEGYDGPLPVGFPHRSEAWSCSHPARVTPAGCPAVRSRSGRHRAAGTGPRR